MTPRGEILADIRAALNDLTTQPEIHTHFSDVIASDCARSLVIGPGDQESVDAESQPGAPGGVRRFQVRVICTAWTREEADEIAFEVEDAFPFEPSENQLGAMLLETTFSDYAGTPERPTERVYFSTVVNAVVYYERAAV